MKFLTYLAMAILSLTAAVEAGKRSPDDGVRYGPGGILLDASDPPAPWKRYAHRA